MCYVKKYGPIAACATLWPASAAQIPMSLTAPRSASFVSRHGTIAVNAHPQLASTAQHHTFSTGLIAVCNVGRNGRIAKIVQFLPVTLALAYIGSTVVTNVNLIVV